MIKRRLIVSVGNTRFDTHTTEKPITNKWSGDLV